MVVGISGGMGLFWPMSGPEAPVICLAICLLSLVVAVVALQTDPRAGRSKTMRTGAVLLLLGAMGLALHGLYRYGFAAPPAAEPLWIRALLWSLLIGSTVYSAGGYHIDATGVGAKRVFLVGLACGLLGYALPHILLQQVLWNAFGLCITLGYLWFGYDITFRFRPPRPKALAPPGREHLF